MRSTQEINQESHIVRVVDDVRVEPSQEGPRDKVGHVVEADLRDCLERVRAPLALGSEDDAMTKECAAINDDLDITAKCVCDV